MLNGALLRKCFGMELSMEYILEFILELLFLNLFIFFKILIHTSVIIELISSPVKWHIL